MNDNSKSTNFASKLWREVFELFESFSTAIVIVVLIFTLLFRIFVVDGPSMESTLFGGDRIIVTNMFYDPKPGDVIVFSDDYAREEGGKNTVLVKRVIAVEGQTVDISSKGEVLVDGAVINEPYLDTATVTLGRDFELPCTVGKGQLFVMGDNRGNSLDSRSSKIGLADTNKVLGKVVFRLFPNFGVIDDGK